MNSSVLETVNHTKSTQNWCQRILIKPKYAQWYPSMTNIPLSWLLEIDRATWIPSPVAMVTCSSRSSLALRPFSMCWVRGITDFAEEKASLLTSSSNFSLHEKWKHYNFSRENTANRNSSRHLKRFFIKTRGAKHVQWKVIIFF